jgi:hypothetical protein
MLGKFTFCFFLILCFHIKILLLGLMWCRSQKYHVFRKTDAVWDKSGIAGQQFYPICAPQLGCVEFSLANPQVLAQISPQILPFFLDLLGIRGFLSEF